jgi:hypothetical protein
MRGYHSAEAKNGARSILQRSRERVASGNTSMPIRDRGINHRNPAASMLNQGTEKRVYNRESRPSGFNGRNSDHGRPPVIDRRMNRTPGETGFHGRTPRTFSRQDSMNRQNGMNFQRPSAGESRSFSPHPQGGGQRYGSSFMDSKGFSGSLQGGNYGSRLGRGGPRF